MVRGDNDPALLGCSVSSAIAAERHRQSNRIATLCRTMETMGSCYNELESGPLDWHLI